MERPGPGAAKHHHTTGKTHTLWYTKAFLLAKKSRTPRRGPGFWDFCLFGGGIFSAFFSFFGWGCWRRRSNKPPIAHTQATMRFLVVKERRRPPPRAAWGASKVMVRALSPPRHQSHCGASPGPLPCAWRSGKQHSFSFSALCPYALAPRATGPAAKSTQSPPPMPTLPPSAQTRSGYADVGKAGPLRKELNNPRPPPANRQGRAPGIIRHWPDAFRRRAPLGSGAPPFAEAQATAACEYFTKAFASCTTRGRGCYILSLFVFVAKNGGKCGNDK